MAGFDNTSLFGWMFKKTEKEKNEETLSPFVPPTNPDGAFVAGGSWYGSSGMFLNLDESFEDENQLIRKYRQVALMPEIDIAVTEIVNEAINTDDDELSVDIVLDNVTGISDGIKTKISNEFKTILRKLKFNTDGQEIFKRWYVDGRIYFYVVIDPNNPKDGIKELRHIPSIYMRKIREESNKPGPMGSVILESINEYFLYSREISGLYGKRNQKKSATTNAIKVSNDSVCYVPSGEFDETGENVIGYLHKVVRPANKLRMIEDALIIYRLARAPERRAIYVDVGNLPKNKAEEYMETLQRKFKNKIVYDTNTGEVKDQKNIMSMMEDFWLPRREGGRGTEIQTLQGGQNLGEIEDVNYFKRKLYEALNVPIGRISSEQNQGMFDIGRVGTMSRDEVKFSKFISKLRKRFSRLFFDLLKKQLILKNIVTEADWEELQESIVFNFKSDVVFAEMKDAEILKDRISTAQMAEPYTGKFFSVKFVRTHILKQSEEDIKNMDEEIEEEQQKEMETQDAQSNDTPMGGNNELQPPTSDTPQEPDTTNNTPEDGEWKSV